ncbi:MAG TPA: RodZ domain-containing protein [Miltoncostaea sp.]|nr:RodZ domain-containing protein [Miltoncostaea sp.]
MPDDLTTDGTARAGGHGRARDTAATEAMISDHERWLEGRGGRRATGAGLSLAGADLRGADLRRADLSGQSLRGANLRGARLGRTVLAGADLSHANLTWAALGEADLRGAMLVNARLAEANLSGADLRRAVLRQADLTGAHLAGARLGGADLIGTNLLGTTWGDGPPDEEVAGYQGPVLAMTDLRGADLSGFDLRGADLTGADLSEADLRGADLRGARLFRATLTGALLEDALLEGADFEGSDMRGSGGADGGAARGHREREGGIRPPVVLAAAIALAIGVGGALGIPALLGGDDPVPSSALEYRPSSSRTVAAARQAEADAAAVTLRAVGTGSWVEVRAHDENGDVLFRGLLDAGARKRWDDPGTLWMRVGAPTGLRVTTDGTEHALAGTTGDFLVGRAGITRL